MEMCKLGFPRMQIYEEDEDGEETREEPEAERLPLELGVAWYSTGRGFANCGALVVRWA